MKMYPFSAKKHAHDIELVKNRAYNMAYEASDAGNMEEAERLFKIHDEACDLLIAIQDGMQGWTGVTMLTGPMLGKAKEMVLVAAEIRDNKYADEDEYDERDSDWRPGDAPWKAPGMSASDFIR